MLTPTTTVHSPGVSSTRDYPTSDVGSSGPSGSTPLTEYPRSDDSTSLSPRERFSRIRDQFQSLSKLSLQSETKGPPPNHTVRFEVPPLNFVGLTQGGVTVTKISPKSKPPSPRSFVPSTSPTTSQRSLVSFSNSSILPTSTALPPPPLSAASLPAITISPLSLSFPEKLSQPISTDQPPLLSSSEGSTLSTNPITIPRRETPVDSDALEGMPVTPRPGNNLLSPRNLRNGEAEQSGRMGHRRRSLSGSDSIEKYKLQFRKRICDALSQEQLTSISSDGIKLFLIEWMNQQLEHLPFISTDDPSRALSKKVKALSELLKHSTITSIHEKIALRLALLASECLNESEPEKEAHRVWLEQLKTQISTINAIYSHSVLQTTTGASNPKAKRTSATPLAKFINAYDKMGTCSAKLLVTQAIGEKSLNILRQINAGDKALLKRCMNGRNSLSPDASPRMNTTQLDEKDIEDVVQHLATREYGWPLRGEDNPRVWPSVHVERPVTYDQQRMLTELVRCIATPRTALFHQIDVTSFNSYNSTLLNAYKDEEDQDLPKKVITDIVERLSAAGWPSDLPIGEAITSIIREEYTPYFLPLYSLGNVITPLYVIFREILAMPPELGLRLVIKPGAPVTHHIHITSPTTFTTTTQKTYIIKEDLLTGKWVCKSEHVMRATTYWDIEEQRMVKATVAIDGVFMKETPLLTKRAIVDQWFEASIARLKKERESRREEQRENQTLPSSSSSSPP